MPPPIPMAAFQWSPFTKSVYCLQGVMQENNLGGSTSETSVATLMQGKRARFSKSSGKPNSPFFLQWGLSGGRAPLWNPIDWLKIYQNMMVSFFHFPSVFLKFFLSGNWETSNLVEQAIELTVQCKYEIVQQYWLLLNFPLNNTQPVSCFRVSPWK